MIHLYQLTSYRNRRDRIISGEPRQSRDDLNDGIYRQSVQMSGRGSVLHLGEDKFMIFNIFC